MNGLIFIIQNSNIIDNNLYLYITPGYLGGPYLVAYIKMN